jgi:hypothetical protein
VRLNASEGQWQHPLCGRTEDEAVGRTKVVASVTEVEATGAPNAGLREGRAYQDVDVLAQRAVCVRFYDLFERAAGVECRRHGVVVDPRRRECVMLWCECWLLVFGVDVGVGRARCVEQQSRRVGT